MFVIERTNFIFITEKNKQKFFFFFKELKLKVAKTGMDINLTWRKKH